jgi:chorismate mutase
MNSSYPLVSGVRGATQLAEDSPDSMDEAVSELLAAMLHENSLTEEGVISAIFTSTPDLRSSFPASAARRMGWANVPLLGAQEADVLGAMPRVVRVLLHVQAASLGSIKHVYLRGTETLRSD